MALPTDLSSLAVTGTYLDPSGAPLAGHITFTPSAQLTDSTGSTVIPAYPKQYNLSAAGKFTTDALVATDNADILPANWSYLVTLALQNLPTTSWNAALPAAPFSFTATSATPCVFTAAGSAYANGNPVKLTGGSLPAGFTAGTTYFVVSASGTSFSLAATSGGSAIASTSTGSGTVSTASSDISALTPVFSQLSALQYAELLLPTSVQSGSITAAAGQLVLVTTASGNATVALPTGVEAGSQVGVKMVVLGGSNTVTISCTGTDKLNVAGGSTSMTLSMLGQGAGFIYTGSLWVIENDDLPLAQLDNRYMANLVQTAVKTANYTAAANQLVPVSTASGSVTVTLPTAPAGGTIVAVKMVTLGTGNTVSIACGGSDVLNKTGGGTTLTLSLLNQAVFLEYNSGIWIDLASNLPLSQLDARYFPKSQTVTTVNSTFADLFSVASTGSTDPLGVFDLAAGGRTVGGILNEVYYLGYNALQGASGGTSANGSASINWWTDAGDTISGSAHGVETNISWFGPAGTTATAAFQMVAVNDDTNTVNTTIRCGSGVTGSISSNILFTNGNATKTFLIMSNAAGTATFSVPLNCVVTSGTNTMNFEATGTGGVVVLSLEGNNGNAVSAEILFSKFGTSTAWNLNYTAPNLVVTDSTNSRTAMIWEPGASPTAALVVVNSHFQTLNGGSMICGNAALATTATDGFLYLPSCAGTPTGTPSTKTGTIPCVFDNTDGKIYFYTGGAWVGLAD